MKGSNWDEDKLKQLLAKAPKVEDHRTKEDVLNRLQQEGVFDKQHKNKQASPLQIGAVAAVVLLVIGGMFMPSNQSSEEETTTMSDSALERVETEEASSEVNVTTAVMESDSSVKTAVYAEDIAGYVPFTIGLVSDNAASVPVTFLIRAEEVAQSIGDNPSKLALYQYYAPRIEEEALGFVDYHPLQGQLVEEGDTLLHILPADHPYDDASAATALYVGALADTFSDRYQWISVKDEMNTPILMDGVSEPLNRVALQKASSYFVDQQPSGSYLVPNVRQRFETVTDALQYMKIAENDVYESAILESITYTVEEGEIVTVTFGNQLDLNAYDGTKMMQMIEAMLLTAADFDKQVQFKNILQQEWQGFHFTEPLPQPIGANKVYLIE